MYLKQLLRTTVRPWCYFIRYHSAAYITEDKEDLVLDFQQKKEIFPLVWLRDNCPCELCFHANSTSRIINWNNFDIFPKVQSVRTTEDNHLVLLWKDRHISKFSFDWLKQRSFRKEIRENYLRDNYKPSKVVWNKDAALQVIKKYEYEDIMNNDKIFYEWLIDLATFGIVFLEHVPINKSECSKLAKKIAFIRKTHYEDQFEIKAKPGTSNVAYLSSLLQLHTDLPYYEYTPGATMLHCLVQATGTGGESLLSDGFYVAEKLRKEDKEAFDILSNVEVNWLDIGQEHGRKYHTIYRCPVIGLDAHGNIDKIYHSVPQRDSYFTVDLKFIKPWYKAMKSFVNSINQEAYIFKLKPGELITFDNTRLLHGRLSYKDTVDNQRHLIGCYVDWDEIYSKLRVLKPSK